MKSTRLVEFVGLAAAAFVAAGCSGMTLSHDDQVRLLMANNRDLEDKLLACERRVADLTAAGAHPVEVKPPPADPYRATAIQFGKTTAALYTDATRGDPRLKIVLEPLDADGEVVKRAGSLELETLEPQPQGGPPKPFHTWKFTQPELAQAWLNSMGIRGYILRLPWPDGRLPASETLLVRARFTTLTGEVLAAEVTVEMRRAPVQPKR